MTTDAPEAAAPPHDAPPEALESDRTLVFEQPLNERMRTFLRLDFLYSQALYHNETASQWGTRAAVSSLIDILAIITRSDVRSEALKELERQLTLLGEFQSKPGVDTNRLKSPDHEPDPAALGAAERRHREPAAAQGLGLPERHQAPQQHPRRHLRVRPAGLPLLAVAAGRDPGQGLQPVADGAATAV